MTHDLDDVRTTGGLAGRLGALFLRSKLTPVIVVFSILLGVGAIYLTPKEEEPQISVPMIDIHLTAVGLEAEEIEQQLTEPIERAVWGLEGVEFVYSSSQAHQSLVTVRFRVGENMETSLVKVHHALMGVRQDLPPHAMQPVVRSYTIDDVPFMILTFSSSERDDYDLRKRLAPLARELSSAPDLGRIEMAGGRKRAIRVIVDPKKLAVKGVSLLTVAKALSESDAVSGPGKNWSSREVFDVEVGGRLQDREGVANIALGQRGGQVVRLKDVATIVDGPEQRTRVSILFEKPRKAAQAAVSIVLAKRKGADVVHLAEATVRRAELFKAQLPSDIHMTVMRNYGETASEKTHELIKHLLLATFSVALLIALAMGIRASLVVSIAIPVTLALTLAIYYFMGYTLNRVTLFALIFSIGILVDDAIVVVENIERHFGFERGKRYAAAVLRAVSEVGNPTILATFTVIAAILPMAFVRGLMGPYMRPIPVGASLAMLLSLFVAFMITPWASLLLLKRHHSDAANDGHHEEGKIDRLYRRVMSLFLSRRRAATLFGAFTVMLLLGSAGFVIVKWVKVKMLPFDNKPEFQVLVDYPTTTSLKTSAELSTQLAQELLKDPDIEAVQVFAGESAPYSFSGMVKHVFLRQAEHLNDLQVKLVEKSHRRRSSHQIIEDLRPRVETFGKRHEAITKLLEIPPGPPVLATMLAEVYAPTERARIEAAKRVEEVFRSEPSVVDLDVSWRPGRPRVRYAFDRQQAGGFQVTRGRFQGLLRASGLWTG